MHLVKLVSYTRRGGDKVFGAEVVALHMSAVDQKVCDEVECIFVDIESVAILSFL